MKMIKSILIILLVFLAIIVQIAQVANKEDPIIFYTLAYVSLSFQVFIILLAYDVFYRE